MATWSHPPRPSGRHRSATNPLDITNTIRKVGRSYFAFGPTADVWEGKYSNIERGSGSLAVKAIRLVPVNRGVADALYQTLSRKGEIWKALSHENVVPFLGLATGIGHMTSLVMPKYANGNVVSYVKSHPDANRRKLALDVATGLQYLHTYRVPVIHGNLKGTNVLVKDDGTACLVDFGLIQILDSVDFSTASIAGPVRWLAPEVMNSEDPSGAAVYTKESDIYAFAMTTIEIYTGLLPFSHVRNDGAVIFRVLKGERPSKPVDAHMNDTVWRMLEGSWNQEPKDRFDLEKIKECLE